jgi:DNA-directed RNA polymerase specialized sigma24 family protein
VRRRGFLEDADDLVQTVLCDALAVQAVPAEAADLPRFVTGIASRKVADERRRRARWKHAELPELGVSMVPEATDLLARIDAELSDPEQRRSLDWLLREHAGDSLLEIAREHALRPETLRQRICRLRRHLRAVHVWPLALLLGLGFAIAPFESVRTAHAPSVATVRALAAYEGTWRVVDWAPSHYPALGLSVIIHDGAARVQSATGVVERELQFQFQSGKRVTLRAGNSVWDAQLSSADAAHLKLTTARGFVELERLR